MLCTDRPAVHPCSLPRILPSERGLMVFLVIARHSVDSTQLSTSGEYFHHSSSSPCASALTLVPIARTESPLYLRIDANTLY